MEMVGIKRMVLKNMSKKRKYYNHVNSPSDFWWIPFILSIMLVFIFINLVNLKIMILNIFVFVLILIVSLFSGILYLISNRDKQLIYKVPEMSKEALKRSLKVEKKFTASVLAEALRVGIQTTRGIKLPSVSVWVADDLDTGAIFIENLGSYEKLDHSKMIESISGILPSPYETVASYLVTGGKFIQFEFEDTTTSHKFIVHNHDFSPFISKDVHSIRLSDDLVWNARKVPHFSIIGRSGSAKSSFSGGYIANVAILQGWQVFYASVKPDQYTKKFNGYTTPERITQLAENLVKYMHKRLAKIQKKGADDYGDLESMNDIAFFIDEIGHLNALLDSDKKLKLRFENAMKSLSFTGRSAGIHLIGISQFATIEAFLPSSVRGNMKDGVVLLGNTANSGEERKFLIPGFNDLPNRNYQRGQGIAMVLESGNKWKTPHYFETPLII